MIKFKATVEQLKKLYCLLYNASIPVGLGHLHYVNKDMEPDEVLLDLSKGFYMDYVGGRMVKFICRVVHDEPQTYQVNLDKPRIDYQSWALIYPTIESVLEAAGITDITNQSPPENTLSK